MTTETASRRDMLVRLLENLKGLWLNIRDDRRALAAVERLMLLRPDLVAEHRTGGILLARLGRHGEAIEQLQAYLEAAPAATDADRIRRLVRRLRAGEQVELEPPSAPEDLGRPGREGKGGEGAEEGRP